MLSYYGNIGREQLEHSVLMGLLKVSVDITMSQQQPDCSHYLYVAPSFGLNFFQKNITMYILNELAFDN